MAGLMYLPGRRYAVHALFVRACAKSCYGVALSLKVGSVKEISRRVGRRYEKSISLL